MWSDSLDPLATSIAMAWMASGPALAADRTDPLAPTGRWSANQDGQAALPPMGWNSWNSFAPTITEAQTLEQAGIHQHLRLVSLDQIARASNRPRGAVEMQLDAHPGTFNPSRMRPFQASSGVSANENNFRSGALISLLSTRWLKFTAVFQNFES